MHDMIIASGENDILIDTDGQRYIDLISGHGAAWLGHANPAITRAVAQQMKRVSIVGSLATNAAADAQTSIESFFPESHYLGGLYSTGMEAAEFAIRLARTSTKANAVLGFSGNYHGKSLAVSYLGWVNPMQCHLAGFKRLPYVSSHPESEILELVARTVAAEPTAAIFVEPLQGVAGGHIATNSFCAKLNAICAAHGVILVFDEILTGFYKTGKEFFFSQLSFTPDVVLIGKALGNGFPVSGVVVNRKHAITAEMFPGSTYAGNPVAAAAVVATLRQIRRLDMSKLVAKIECVLQRILRPVEGLGFRLRGKGALWLIETPSEVDPQKTAVALLNHGVLVSYGKDHIRLIPPATIEERNLLSACEILKQELIDQVMSSKK